MIDQKMNTLRILWVALFSSPGVFLIAGYLVTADRRGVPVPDPILLPALAATALGAAVASLVLPKVILRPALVGLKLPLTDAPSPGPSAGRRRPRRFADVTSARSRLLMAAQPSFILGMAMAEAVALHGFVLWILGFDFAYVIPLFLVSWVLMVGKFPRLPAFERELEAVYDADLA